MAQGGQYSVALSTAAPLGGLDTLAKQGFGLSVRAALGEPDNKWSGRGTFGFDYFPGKGLYANIQFLAIGFDVVHRSTDHFYQFAGLFQSGTKYALNTASGAQALRQGNDFGLTGGVGVNFKWQDTNLFAEFAATTVFTGASNSNWMPIRIGMRF